MQRSTHKDNPSTETNPETTQMTKMLNKETNVVYSLKILILSGFKCIP